MSLQPPSWSQDPRPRFSATTQAFCTAPLTDTENGNRVKLLRLLLPALNLRQVAVLISAADANSHPGGHPQQTNTRSQLLGIYPASVYAPG